jgi:hypothetical protein
MLTNWYYATLEVAVSAVMRSLQRAA